MKKMFFSLLLVFFTACILGAFGCRTRVASAPLPEPTGTMTPTATVTPAPTAAPSPGTLVYDFEGGLDGWSLGGDPGCTEINDVSTASVPGNTVPSGSYCAAVTCVFSSATDSGEIVVHPSPADLSSSAKITAHVYVPADLPAAYSVQIFILTMPGYGFTGQNMPALTLGAWNTGSLNITGITNINNVGTIAVQLLRNAGPAWSGTIYVDYVTVN